MVKIVASDHGGPVTRALVIGVSRYPYAHGPAATERGSQSGITDLSSAARSASAFAAWLMTEYRQPDKPLAHLNVLLSPADGEALDPAVASRLGADPSAYAATQSAVKSAVVALREDCRNRPDDIVMVYIAGHGVQLSKHDAIVLLEDYAAGHHARELEGAIDALGCQRGFDGDGFPATQFWFVDACRQPPAVARRFESLDGAAISLDEPLGRVDSTPVFLASSTRQAAFAEIGGTSLFSQALLWALSGGAAVGADSVCDEWHVRTSSLIDQLGPHVRRLADNYAAEQHVDVTGRPGPGLAHRFEQAPSCELSISVAPTEAATATTARLTHGDTNIEYPLSPTWPLTGLVPAGLYILDVVSQAPYLSRPKPLHALPPTTDVEVTVTS